MIHTIDLHFLGQPNTIAAYLLESSAGPILIETGPHSTFENLRKGLAEKGYQPEEVRHVFITHIHLDHAGAAWTFAEKGSTIYLHPFGFKHMADPSKLMASAKRIYQDKMDMLWGRMEAIPEAQLRTVDHEEIIQIGELQFVALHTPGHAVHHIAWQVGDECFTGDVAGVKIRDGLVVPPCPPPDIQLEAWEASLALLRQRPIRRLWLTHFGPIEAPMQHYDALEARLHAYANWIKPHFEAGTPQEEVVPQFQAFVENELRAHGVQGDHLTQYNYANPPWMSVAGLYRYWKKLVG
ncbi:MAG: MBL fold metallo-hydrolase [Phaeodactylibacter sp.]|nr:MBL fold metallo-hydrolase [Phaeodactylibacter sp.]